MKKSMKFLAVSVAMGMFFAFPVLAEMDHSGHDHSKHKKENAAHKMNHSGHMGDMIRQEKVEHYGFMYHLIDMMAKMKGMEGKHQMKATHHLMVYIKAPHGHNVKNAKVGYMVTGPDGKKQKAMAMGMSGGFGADINLKQKGTYKITTKALSQDKVIKDTFTYEVK